MENELFEKMPVRKAYIKLAVPLVLSMMVTMIYNLADTYFIAATGNTDLVAGVSLCAPVFTFLMAIGNIFGQGGTSLISRMLGQKNTDGVHRISSFCFYAAILSGAVIGGLMLLFNDGLLKLLGADASTLSHASEYYMVLAIGAPFTVLSFIHSNLLRAEGRSKESMITSVSGAVLNIILDPILISVCGWGAKGAAVATVLGYLCSDLYALSVVLRKSENLSIIPGKAHIDRREAGQIFGIGIPAAIVNICSSICMILTNQYLLSYGNDKIAAMGIVLKVTMVAQLILTGLSFGGQPLIGYFYGAKNHERMKELIHFSFTFLTGVALILTVLLFFSAPLILKAFMKDDAMIQIGVIMLRWQVASSVFAALVQLITIYFQSTGHMTGSFLLSISRQGVVFILALIILAKLFGLNGIVTAQFTADLVSAVFAVTLFKGQLYKELME